MKFITTKLPVFVLMAVLFFMTNTFGQGKTTASISGVITDQNGAPLPAASIIAVHVPTGTQYGTSSRNDGRYNLLGLKVGGPYKLTVSFVGYGTQTKENIQLGLSEELTVNFKLAESTIELSGVTVVGEKSKILNVNRTGAAQNVSVKDIETLPTINRQFQDFAKLSPQASGTNSQIAGRSNRFNNIQIDGTQHNDLFGLGSTGTPGGQTGTTPISLDAIQEFQVVVAPFDVRFGGFTGGGINAITRSGTNQFHASAFGFGRNQGLVGKAGFINTGNDADKDFPDFDEYQYGVRIGGPIQKDKIFFFVSGERDTRTQPISNLALSAGPANAQALADRMASILKNKYGYDPGTAAATDIDRPSNKVFVRLDFNLSENHKLTLRNNYVDASDDILRNRNRNNRLSFSTYAYSISNKTNSAVAQLNSTFKNNLSNELSVGFTTIRDKRHGISADAPEIEVNETGLRLTAGPDRFSSANRLDQDIFEVTDNLTFLTGDHIFTVGTHNEFFSFTNLFIRSFFGFYSFNSLDDLENGNPSFYQRVFSRTSDPNQPAEFSVNQFGFYAQDEWKVTPNFKLTLGMRVDIPVFPDNPAQNDSVSKYFPGRSTTDVPSGNIHYSPRLGFNWDVNGDRSTQVRGGVGIFTGRPAYVWISNNYGNSGVLYAEVRGSGSALGFRTDPLNQPGVGDPGTGAPRLTSEIDLADPNLKFPQVLRFNLGVDQQLPYGFVGTVDFIYGESVNDFVYRKLNLKNENNPGTLPGEPGRLMFGGTNRFGNFFDVLELTNTSEGFQYNISAQIQRSVARGLSINAGYTFGKAEDVNSVLSSQARSQMRFNPISGNPNTPPRTTSTFEIKHRIFASVSYTEEFIKNAPTTISIFYNGQSGQPFSFIVGGDLNNDGFDNNDLFYIPKDRNDILLGSISGGVYVPASSATYDALESFINNNDYLSANRGKMSERNGARNPWRDILDLRIMQDVPIIPGHTLQFTWDVLNVLNLLNSDWGWDESVFSTYRIVTPKGIDPATGREVYSFAAPKNNTPFTANDLNSRWAMQFGVRYSF